MKNPIKWLRWKLEYRQLIKQLSDVIGDRTLYLVIKEVREGELVQIGNVDDLEEAYGDLYKEADREREEE